MKFSFPQPSPLFLFQERYRLQPWRVLVVAILLNQSSGKQLEEVHESLFKLWPNAESMAAEDPKLVATVIYSMGFQNRKSRHLVEMSKAYLKGDWTEVDELPGCGKYARDSYEIFVRGNFVPDVKDKELRKWQELAQVEVLLPPAV